jgi:hypothetical protein
MYCLSNDCTGGNRYFSNPPTARFSQIKVLKRPEIEDKKVEKGDSL